MSWGLSFYYLPEVHKSIPVNIFFACDA